MSSPNSSSSASLERIFAAAERQSRGFLPLPAHLSTPQTQDAYTRAYAVATTANAAGGRHASSSTTADGTPDPQLKHDTAPIPALEAARAVCIDALPGLRAWEADCAAALADAAKARAAVAELQGRLSQIEGVTTTVREYGAAMSADASALIAKRARHDRTLQGLTAVLRQLHRIDGLYDEALHPRLQATSARFVALLDEIEGAAALLAQWGQFQATPAYAARLSTAYQRAMGCLRDTCAAAFRRAAQDVVRSTMFRSLFIDSRNAPPMHHQVRPRPGATSGVAGAAAVPGRPFGVAGGAAGGAAGMMMAAGLGNAMGALEAATGGAGGAVGSASGAIGAFVGGGAAAEAMAAAPPPTSPALRIAAVRPATLGAALALVNSEFAARVSELAASALRCLEARCGAAEAEPFAVDVFAAYSDARLELLRPLLRDYSPLAPAAVIAAGAAGASGALQPFDAAEGFVQNLVDACREERAAYDATWLAEAAGSFRRAAVEAVAAAGYDVFRGQLLGIDGVSTLSALSAALWHAVDARSDTRDGEATSKGASSDGVRDHDADGVEAEGAIERAVIRDVAQRMAQDAQERLLFRVSVFIAAGLVPANAPVPGAAHAGGARARAVATIAAAASTATTLAARAVAAARKAPPVAAAAAAAPPGTGAAGTSETATATAAADSGAQDGDATAASVIVAPPHIHPMSADPSVPAAAAPLHAADHLPTVLPPLDADADAGAVGIEAAAAASTSTPTTVDLASSLSSRGSSGIGSGAATPMTPAQAAWSALPAHVRTAPSLTQAHLRALLQDAALAAIRCFRAGGYAPVAAAESSSDSSLTTVVASLMELPPSVDGEDVASVEAAASAAAVAGPYSTASAAAAGASASAAAPGGLTMCEPPVLRLRWLLQQLRRAAQDATAFAPFIDEAVRRVLASITAAGAEWRRAATDDSLLTAVATAASAPSWGETPPASASVVQAASRDLVSSVVPPLLLMRQLLLVREALVATGPLQDTDAALVLHGLQRGQLSVARSQHDISAAAEVPLQAAGDEVQRVAADFILGAVGRIGPGGALPEDAVLARAQLARAAIVVCLDGTAAAAALARSLWQPIAGRVRRGVEDAAAAAALASAPGTGGTATSGSGTEEGSGSGTVGDDGAQAAAAARASMASLNEQIQQLGI